MANVNEIALERALANLLEWAKGNRGPKHSNPYGVPEVQAALTVLASRQKVDTANYLAVNTARLAALPSDDELERELAKKNYIDADGLRCPYCNSTHLDDLGDDRGYYSVKVRVKCMTCYKYWTDELTLTNIIFEEEEGNE